jgi:hypothetical protein
MRASLAVAAFGLALGVVATSSPESHAQSPQSYRYCSLHNGGGTDCYFNDRTECANQGSHRCVDNPSYIGNANARAQGSVGRYHKIRD